MAFLKIRLSYVRNVVAAGINDVAAAAAADDIPLAKILWLL